ncbi:putative C-_U-editing enzyme APOBEC-4 [Hemicordylus capensis]|uniref:putative C->U-editing enzyme APOBEC-4 n=1 Tax=Hemicordylus capensis TaxID=884348 RepID=UPI0023029D63|nr:putative C->U-editing enzyme APOBEC-4 [Hemicordylus capensis]
METFCQEYLSHKGTLVKPYYWLAMSPNCTECPYHIQTGEEARVPYVEFHRAFGFPYGPIHHQNKHLLFYELRHFSGNLMQKGHATNCTEYNIHPESMLFGMGGYLDSVVQTCENAAYIIIYSNYTPCNEAEHGCISKIYSFLTKYPDITLCIYFSQLYHTEEDFPVSTWNCEALRSLASMWPQVILSPLCGGLWHSVLYSFVTTMPHATSFHPVLPVRALMDRQNAQRINNITGKKFPFMNTLPQPIYGNPTAVPNLQKYYLSTSDTPHPTQMMNSRLPPLRMPPHLMPPFNVLPPFGRQPLYSRPKNVVRHLKMPDESLSEAKLLQVIPNGRSFHVERITEQLSDSKSAAHKGHRKKKH